jgi:hypothetical protein
MRGQQYQPPITPQQAQQQLLKQQHQPAQQQPNPKNQSPPINQQPSPPVINQQQPHDREKADIWNPHLGSGWIGV